MKPPDSSPPRPAGAGRAGACARVAGFDDARGLSHHEVEFTSPVFWFFFLLTGLSLLRSPAASRAGRGEQPFRVLRSLSPGAALLFCAACGYLLYSSVSYSMTLELPLGGAGRPCIACSRRSHRAGAVGPGSFLSRNRRAAPSNQPCLCPLSLRSTFREQAARRVVSTRSQRYRTDTADIALTPLPTLHAGGGILDARMFRDIRGATCPVAFPRISDRRNRSEQEIGNACNVSQGWPSWPWGWRPCRRSRRSRGKLVTS